MGINRRVEALKNIGNATLADLQTKHMIEHLTQPLIAHMVAVAHVGHQTREQFTHSSLLSLVRKELGQHYQDKSKKYDIPTVDRLASALTMFSLKYPSLLQFDKDRTKEESALHHNLRTLYVVNKAPCDTQMRERLDGLGAQGIRTSFKAIMGRLQRGKVS